MKKYLLMMFAGLLVASCEKPILGDVEEESDVPEIGGGENRVKNFTFTVKGDFSSPSFTGGYDDIATHSTRAGGYLSADGGDITHLWVFDFMDGVCVQKVKQLAGDDDWGKPKMSLKYGEHHIYFVAARGSDPTVNETAHTITWGSTRDTFWKDYEVNVVSTSNGNRAVTLDRVVAKLRVTIDDELPDGAASFCVTPDKWYYGLNYVTGEPVSEQHRERASNATGAVGTTGASLAIYSISRAEEWTTDVVVAVKNANGDVLGSVVINDAPFKRNTVTEYHGNLFSNNGDFGLSLNSSWDDIVTKEW